ncbi:MAG: ATPase, AFG1 family [uncultured Thiotrichaceae bacterium]|uniref:ATPase, AFG1 family n=1 Tax=uncultured Thiotrichaceae bacterium TaxID=298394 RepID=A0A6S6T5H9_9GAMM|nr:MAG: ATPase, AFG1 family [uncultured Thiotrichaceae bacterium]
MGLTENNSTMLNTKSSDDFLLASYLASVAKGELNADPYQKAVMVDLQRVYNDVVRVQNEPTRSPPTRSRFGNLFSIVSSKAKPKKDYVKGLYLWGGVGRGKTHLVDYFYKLLPDDMKLRLHFHRFMQLVHEELKQQGSVEDPLHEVAKNIAAKSHILFLDEMHVTDITDAMLLGRLFEHLFELGLVLVTTSNVPPNGLYKDGLQRQRFIPAIELLEKHTKVVEMGGDMDYRLQTLEQAGLYQIATGALSDQRLETYFHQLASVELHQDRKDILINHRNIPVKMWADGVVWFNFQDLCNTPRSSDDYTQIATFFHTVLISDIPVMNNHMDDAARRFIKLIDSFYDMHVNIVVSAEAEPEKLYTSTKLEFEFQRTTSRLIEMQSKEYLAIEHLS